MPNQKPKLIFLVIVFWAVFASAQNAQAATYYVSPAGNDSNSGLSDAQAWKTINKVNSQKFTNGDDIYFKCGGKWTETVLQPNVQGVNESNRTVIGAYYGNGTIGVSGNEPIFDGAKLSIPAKGSYSGLVNFSEKSYVTVENLHVQWSGGIGIQVSKGSYNVIRHCYVASTYRHGIRFYSTTSYNTCEYNTVTDTGQSRLDGIPWPAAIALVGDDGPSRPVTNTIVRYNYVYLNRGEGIDLIKGCNDSVVEYNTVVNNQSADIYLTQSAKRNIVRYNLVYGYSGAPWHAPCGIGVNDEGNSFTYAGSEGNKIYGNFIANEKYGIELRTQHADAVVKDTDVYNNTIIDSEIGILATEGPNENSFVKNNIVWCTGAHSSCVMAQVPSSHSGLTFDYNLWSSQPSASVRGNHDPVNTAPKLVKTSGWNNAALGSLSFDDFKLQSASPAINKGSTLASNFNLDYWNTLRPQDSAWDIGAHEYTTGSGDTTPPSAPSGLSVR